MKLTKIFAVTLAALSLTACSDDETNVNTAEGVTVGLQDSFTYEDRDPATTDTLYVNENAGIFTLPINVYGEANGDIYVNIEVVAGQGIPTQELEPAKEIEHYVVTSKRIRIPAGEQEAEVEFNSIWKQGVVDNNRTFTVKIASVEGANVGNASTPVTIVNIDNPATTLIGQLVGNWKFTGYDYDGVEVDYDLSFVQPDATSSDYGSTIYGVGMLNYSFVYVPLRFVYDKDSEEVVISIPLGELACTGAINFGSFIGVLATDAAQEIYLTLSEDKKELTADPTAVLTLIAINTDNDQVMGIFDRFTNMKFTRQ